MLFGIPIFVTSIYKMSVKKCCVPLCNKSRDDNVILHLFPNPIKDAERFGIWKNTISGHILALDDETIFKLRRVCHLHFEIQYNTWSKRLSPNAVPTLNISGFRRPLQDMTNTAAVDAGNSGVYVGNSGATVESTENSGVNIESNNSVQFIEPQPSSSRGDTRPSVRRTLRPIKCFSPRITVLRNKIRAIQKSKESSLVKLKSAVQLCGAPSFKEIFQNFTSAATIFTLLQFREVGKPTLGRRFEKKEKILALALYKQGPRAYRWLRKIFVLPAPLTLSRMIQSASLKPGINENLFEQLSKMGNKMKTNDKLCILLFDEIALTPHFDYNRRTDTITGFVDNGYEKKGVIADHALVFMIRGLMRNYKQPISYTFCAKTTPKMEIVTQIKMIISRLQSIGFIVVATVCDQGSTNVSAINYLINENKNKHSRTGTELRHAVFEIEGQEIIPLYDPPHLLKGIRNNLLNKDLLYCIENNQKVAKWEHIMKLYAENPAFQGIRLVPKLTDRHVIPNKISKMKVKCATQVFSRTVAANMGYLASYGILPKECEDTAQILFFFDNLFDSLNGSFNKSNKRTGKPLLGAVTNRSPHRKLWGESKYMLKTMKYVSKNGKIGVVPSITHWLLLIENIEYLIDTLSNKFDVTSIWMRHFNQDPLENFFGCIRSHGYRNTSPSCASFEAAYASLLVNNISNINSPGSNCETDSCYIFKSLQKIFFNNKDIPEQNIEVDFEDIAENNFINIEDKIQNKKVKAQIEYVTGYVLRRLKTKVFKNCRLCNSYLFDTDKKDSSLIYREYFKNKSCLTYPNAKVLQCFSNIQDTIIFILRKRCYSNNLKSYIRTVLSIIIDYNFINCEEHKQQIINMLENTSINLFILNWCKTNNKLMSGDRTDYEENDLYQKMCYDFYKSRNKKISKYEFVLLISPNEENFFIFTSDFLKYINACF